MLDPNSEEYHRYHLELRMPHLCVCLFLRR
jgi:hypothetical protein